MQSVPAALWAAVAGVCALIVAAGYAGVVRASAGRLVEPRPPVGARASYTGTGGGGGGGGGSGGGALRL